VREKVEEISATEAARRLSSTVDYVYKLLRVGKLPGRTRDGRWFVSAEAVQAKRDQRKE
jgi:hypothetical protein